MPPEKSAQLKNIQNICQKNGLNETDLLSTQNNTTLRWSGFCFFASTLYVPVNKFQSCRDGSSWVEPVLKADKVSCSRIQHSESAGDETRTINPSIPRLTLYQLYCCSLEGSGETAQKRMPVWAFTVPGQCPHMRNIPNVIRWCIGCLESQILGSQFDVSFLGPVSANIFCHANIMKNKQKKK